MEAWHRGARRVARVDGAGRQCHIYVAVARNMAFERHGKPNRIEMDSG